MSRDRLLTTTVHGRTFEIIVAGDDKHDWRLANPDEQGEYDRLRRLDMLVRYREITATVRWHIIRATEARLDMEHYGLSARRRFEEHVRAASVKLRIAVNTARSWGFTQEEIAA